MLPPSEENLRRASQALAAGRLVSFPTETVYGLGANAFDSAALARIFEAKRRPFFDPLIIHIADRKYLEPVCAMGALPGAQSLRAEKLMDRFWPGPLTLVLPKTDAVPDLATSGLPTVAVRMPAHPVALALIRMAGFPLAAPSANPFGRLSPTSAAHVRDQFQDGIDLILDGGTCAVGLESTILSLEGETPALLRAGGVPREDIEALIGPVATAEAHPLKLLAPGQLPGHYAPRTRLRLLATGAGAEGWERAGWEGVRSSGPESRPDGPSESGARKVGWLGFRMVPSASFAAAEVLSPSGSLREAAANLFACLHRLDQQGLDLILAESVPEAGLGLAIMDRLRKAAAGSGEGT